MPCRKRTKRRANTISLKNMAIRGDRPEKSVQKICEFLPLSSHVFPCCPGLLSISINQYCWRTAGKTVSQMPEYCSTFLPCTPSRLAGSDEDEAPGFARRVVSLFIGMGWRWLKWIKHSADDPSASFCNFSRSLHKSDVSNAARRPTLALSTKSKKGTKRFDDILSELSETFTAFIVTVTQELAKVIKVVSRRVF